MNILYLNHYAGSPQYGMEFRPYHMAKEWVKKGHNVSILAADFSHVRAKQPATHGQKITETIDAVDYTWYPTPKYNKNGFGRVKNIFTFLWQVYKDSNHIVNEFSPDLVIASSTYPLDIWVAKRIAKKAKAKLVFEVHDLWPLSPIELGGMSPKHPFIMLCQAAENYAYKHADRVVSMLPKVHEHMASHGLDLDKLTIVPNGVVEEDWVDSKVEELDEDNLLHFLKTKKMQGKIIVGYAGSLGVMYGLNDLLQAFKYLEERNIICIIVGSGLERDKLITYKTREEINNVFFFKPIPKTQIPSLLCYFDIAYMSFLSMPLFRFGISPNKLMDYMMAAKPVLCAINAGNDPVAEAHCGLTVAPENPKAIADGINQLANLSQAEREEMGQRGREFILKNQTYSVLADKFLEAMQ